MSIATEVFYQTYSRLKKMIKHAESCSNHDHHSLEQLELLATWRRDVAFLESIYPELPEKYENKQHIIESFSHEQIDHICFQIGEWYTMMKPLMEGQHNLGFMKEKLKTMICG